ncbi:nucleotidyltransferase domain-containing protein [Pseudolactococcus yaeyamensis]
MKKTIQDKLKQIEQEQNITILHAVESGSRAWGFPSKDSDYDVRFIYKRPPEWYLRLEKTKDSLEFPINDELDISGWDLDKTLVLLRKTNPSLVEWLNSPIVYAQDDKFIAEIRELYETHINEKALIFHYLHMAEGNYRGYLTGKFVKIKKYFYVIRPLLACLWVATYHEKPPVAFEKLLTLPHLSKAFLDEVESLLVRKKAGDELDLEQAIPVINQFITEKLSYFSDYANEANEHESLPYEKLNAFFLEWIGFER